MQESAMKVAKVFNNSVVLAMDESGAEEVLLGRGVGFQVKPGSPVRDELVEKRYKPSLSAPAERVAALLADIPLAEITLAEEVVALGRQRLGGHVAENAVIPLADHISCALRRMREGHSLITYPMQWEVRHLYPAEAQLADDVLALIERRTGVTLPAQEATPLALHFVNSQLGSGPINEALAMTRLLAESFDVVRREYGVTVDESGVDAARFVTHIRFLFARQREGLPPGAESDDGLLATLARLRPKAYGCALVIGDLVAESLGRHLVPGELAYLCLHVSRLSGDGLA
jgi:beta-glucoside operon transcriptional antiterminator